MIIDPGTKAEKICSNCTYFQDMDGHFSVIKNAASYGDCTFLASHGHLNFKASLPDAQELHDAIASFNLVVTHED
jgi:hypothetical protein